MNADPGYFGASAHPLLDMRERGSLRESVVQYSDKRLFMQLQVFSGCRDPKPVLETLRQKSIEAVVYADLNDPSGVGVLLMSEDPSFFVTKSREFFEASGLNALRHRRELTMTGKTYALGREHDLEDWLMKKPRRNVFNPAWPWAIWYPLRRKPEFEVLSKEEQGKILAEHAKIGMAYGQADLAHDVRLACYGLDQSDNEFVIGLVGAELHPLSRVVQDMRKTIQTSKYIQKLGPFFIGRTIYQTPQS